MTLPLEARLLRKILINNGSAPATNCSPYCTPDSHQKRTEIKKKRGKEEKRKKGKKERKKSKKNTKPNKQTKNTKELIEAESGRRN